MDIEIYERAKRDEEAIDLIGAEDWRRAIRDLLNRINFANPIPDHVVNLLRLTCNNLHRRLLRDGYDVNRPPQDGDPINIIAWMSETENPKRRDQQRAKTGEKDKAPKGRPKKYSDHEIGVFRQCHDGCLNTPKLDGKYLSDAEAWEETARLYSKDDEKLTGSSLRKTVERREKRT